MIKRYLVLAALLLALCVGTWLVFKHTDLLRLRVERARRIEATGQEVTRIDQIRQWEFLRIATEEMVDTVRPRRLLRDDELCNIYSGTLRLGINLDKAKDPWSETKGRSVTLHLPPVELLDERFINEAAVRVFHERGSWDARAMDDLYRRAAAQMKVRALSRENLKRAEENGRQTFTRIFQAMGYEHVTVTFGP